jgi:hypothetical protein
MTTKIYKIKGIKIGKEVQLPLKENEINKIQSQI